MRRDFLCISENQSGDKKTYVAKRAGAVNEETRYVLERFGVEEPPLVSYAGAQIKDINIRKTAGVSNQISLKRAWELMKKLEVVTLPVTNQFGKLEGVIVTKDIATSYMDVLDNCVLSKARTQYKTLRRRSTVRSTPGMSMHILCAEKL